MNKSWFQALAWNQNENKSDLTLVNNRNMPSPRVLKVNEGEPHFFTFRVIEWINVFTEPIYFQVIIDSFKYCRQKKGLLLHAYVIMTNHIHTIMSAKHNNLSSIVRDFKSYTSCRIKALLAQDNRRYIERLIKRSFFKRKGQKFQIWYSENWPEIIESEDFLQQKLNYIHENPVDKEYVARPEDWLYSSARNYYLDDDSVIEIDKL